MINIKNFKWLLLLMFFYNYIFFSLNEQKKLKKKINKSLNNDIDIDYNQLIKEERQQQNTYLRKKKLIYTILSIIFFFGCFGIILYIITKIFFFCFKNVISENKFSYKSYNTQNRNNSFVIQIINSSPEQNNQEEYEILNYYLNYFIYVDEKKKQQTITNDKKLLLQSYKKKFLILLKKQKINLLLLIELLTGLAPSSPMNSFINKNFYFFLISLFEKNETKLNSNNIKLQDILSLLFNSNKTPAEENLLNKFFFIIEPNPQEIINDLDELTKY
jgi:hypothetical protein